MERDALLSGTVHPGGREPAPGGLALVQMLVNTVDREHGPDLFDDVEGLADWLAARGLLEPGIAPDADDLAAARELREALRSLMHANNGAPEDPGRPRRARRGGGRRRAAADVPGRGPGARPRPRRDRGRARPRRRRHVRGDARRQLGADEGVPARRLRLGVLRPLEQRERHLVLDGGVRRPREGRHVLPAPARRELSDPEGAPPVAAPGMVAPWTSTSSTIRSTTPIS